MTIKANRKAEEEGLECIDVIEELELECHQFVFAVAAEQC